MRAGKTYSAVYIIIISALLVLVLLNIALGSVRLPFREVLFAITGGPSPDFVKDIVLTYRIPKAITAILAGTALSLCGLQMQTLFRNPLADPFILGISSGAGLGVALLVMGFSAFGVSLSSSVISNIGIATAAWIGAIAVTVLIFMVSARLKESGTLLIFGIMLGSVAGALISLIQYFSDSSQLKTYILWTMGSFAGLTGSQLVILFILILAGMAISIYNIKDLNALLSGETYAKSIGVNMEASRRRILIATTLLAGSITAFCGPIGFIGIAVPHIVRMIFRNANHIVLIPASALMGAAIMIFADTVSQLAGAIPINTVSSLIGIPVIFAIILKNKKI